MRARAELLVDHALGAARLAAAAVLAAATPRRRSRRRRACAASRAASRTGGPRPPRARSAAASSPDRPGGSPRSRRAPRRAAPRVRPLARIILRRHATLRPLRLARARAARRRRSPGSRARDLLRAGARAREPDRATRCSPRASRPGARVAFLAKNCAEFVLFYYGAAKAGVVPVPLNYRLAPPEWSYIVNDAGRAAAVRARRARRRDRPDPRRAAQA